MHMAPEAFPPYSASGAICIGTIAQLDLQISRAGSYLSCNIGEVLGAVGEEDAA